MSTITKLGPSAFHRDVADTFDALLLVQAITDFGGRVISVCPFKNRLSVFAIFDAPDVDYYGKVDAHFAEMRKESR